MKKPLRPASSPQLFSTRQRRGWPSTTSTPVNSIAWVICVSCRSSRAALSSGRSCRRARRSRNRFASQSPRSRRASSCRRRSRTRPARRRQDGPRASSFMSVDLDVEVGDDAATDDVAEVLDGEGAAEGAGRSRVVHQADVFVQREIDVLRGDLQELRSGSRWKALSLSVHCQANFRRRAEMDAEDAIDDARISPSPRAARRRRPRWRACRAASSRPRAVCAKIERSCGRCWTSSRSPA